MKQYLVIQLARFGDLVQTKRLVKSLQAEKGSRVHICLDHSLEALARLVYPEAILHPITAHGTGLDQKQASALILTNNRNALLRLAKTDFDEVFNLNFSGLNFSLAALFEPHKVRGYRWKNGQQIKSKWASMAMRWSRNRRMGINIMDFWSGYAQKQIPPQEVNPSAKPGGNGVGVVTAGRESRRSLPPKLLAAITSAIWEKTGRGPMTVLGSAAEIKAAKALIKEFPARLQDKTQNLTGKTDWQGLVDAVSGLDALVTPDTGTMHLAAHLGTPVTAYFLSSAWCCETGPYGLGHTILQADAECLPCLETEPCHNDMLCLRGLADPGLQRYIMTEKPEYIPDGLLALKSDLDSLGVDYKAIAGTDASATRRNEMRFFLQRHLGIMEAWSAPSSAGVFSDLYIERDWMVE